MKHYNILIITLIMFFFSCGNEGKELKKAEPGFGKYIISYTRGEYLSIGARFTVRLRKPVNDSVKAGDKVDAAVFDFSPGIDGQAVWADKRTIEFIPDNYLKPNTVYTVRFFLSKLMDVPEDYAVMKYQVRTMAQDFKLSEGQLSAYGQTMGYYKYEAILTTADVAKSEDVEKSVSIKYSGNDMHIKWLHKKNGTLHILRVDSIKRYEQGLKMEIEVDGKELGVDEDYKSEYRIPGINEFEVLSADLSEDKSSVIITFSDPLLPGQDLDGMIFLKGNHTKFTLDAEGNKVKLSPEHRIKGRQTLIISAGIKNALSYKLPEDVELEVTFELEKPQVRLFDNQVIMPSSKELIFPFEAVSLKAVDLRIIQIFDDNVLFFLQENNFRGENELSRVGRMILQKKIELDKTKGFQPDKWHVYKVDLAKLIDIQPGAIYRVELLFRREYSLYECDSATTKQDISDEEYAAEVKKEMKKYDSEFYSWDYDYPDDFSWGDRDNPCTSSYYIPDVFPGKNIFVSDLGITVKGTSDNRYLAVVADLKSTEAVKGAEVVFYNFQRRKIGEGKTDGDGLLFKKLDAKPYFAVVKKEGQYGYLKLDNGSALSISNFDVAGMRLKEGMKGFIYGERGVWRPGDDIYLTFILKDGNDILPDDYPVKFELFNPLSRLVDSHISRYGENGFYTFHTRTSAEALTGNYLLKVKAGGALFTKTVRVETIKPNRLKGGIKFNGKLLTAADLDRAFTLESKWLHGAPAAGLKFDVKLKLTKTKTEFKKYSQYNFDNAAADFSPREEDIASGKLGSDGKKALTFNISGRNAPGFLNASFTTRVFEKSGNFSIFTQNVKYSPFDTYIGARIVDKGERGWYSIKKKHLLSIVSVDARGKAAPGRRLHLKIYKVAWRWWWQTYNDNLATYLSSGTRHRVFDKYLTTGSDGKVNTYFTIPYHDWNDNGRYLITVSDINGDHSSAFTAYFSEYYGSIGKAGDKATVLAFTADKEKYNIGEEAEIVIPSSKNGHALVSLEKGDKVLKAFWVETQDKETRFKIPLTEEMSPNIYVHISMIQPHSQTVNDNPIRMYGVIPLEVFDSSTKLEPVIKTSKVYEPEKDFSIKVSEKHGEPMTYTLAVVDEGLLDISGYRTPDPWHRFYSREALTVRTWDLYDYVIGAYGARLEKAFAVGGGDKIIDPSKNKTVRFKPVVFFEGPFTLGKKESRVHKFTMPNYVGSVRVMVVAGNGRTYGSSEKAVAVKKDLMILGTLPRVLAPGEDVKLPVTVFAMNKKVKKVRLTVSSNSLLSVADGKSKTVDFDTKGEKVVDFNLKVKDVTGKAKVDIVAVSGTLKATYHIDIEVRNPNPLYTLYQDTVLKAGEKWQGLLKPFGVRGSNKAVLELSSLMPVNLEGRLNYLIRYPYGCVEQSVSSAFPQLYLDKIIDIEEGKRKEIQENVMATLNRLRLFQLPNGGFAYWPGQDYVNKWGTDYAGHFLLAAKEKGYELPSGMLDRWLSYQKSEAVSWSRYDGYGALLEQAYRLYLLSLAGEPELGAMNRMREMALNERSKTLLAGAYALINRKTAALKILEKLAASNDEGDYDWTYGSSIRDDAMKATVLKDLGRNSQAFLLIKNIAEHLASDQWMSTQTTAFALYAFADYFAGNGGEAKGIDVLYNFNSTRKKLKTDGAFLSRELKINDAGTQKIEVLNKGMGLVFVRLMLSGRPEEGREKAKNDNLRMSVRYVDMEGKPIDPAKIKQGTDFKAVVSISNPGMLRNYHNLALRQVFPSGWEIINGRFYGIGGDSASATADYRDIRDDRIYTFFSLPKHKKVVFSVMLNAAYAGRFYMPALQCGAMYDKSIEAVIPGRWVEVVR